MLTVFVTGLIGSGKSAVCTLLSQNGVPVYDSDSRTKSLYRTVPGLVSRLEEELGAKFSNPDGSLDRAALSRILFSSAQAREKLEAIVYPLVLEDFKAWREEQEGAPFVVLESAVILSKPVFDSLEHTVVVVTASEEKRLGRIIRRGATLAQARERMATQQIDLSKADAIIENNGNMEELASEVERVFFSKNSYLCKLEKNNRIK